MGKNWKSYLLPGIAVVFAIAVWTWYDLQNKPANEKILQNLQKLLQEEPGLQPIYDRLNADGKINYRRIT